MAELNPEQSPQELAQGSATPARDLPPTADLRILGQNFIDAEYQ
jgi:hypothetical protein